ncbi:YciI family protein [Caulobacter sp. CCNWLY153]|uniref:YciI family protein n=1 Tax=unclassified Caulobacter TaxID=2648921 RepID=UPI002FF41E17
MKYMLLIYETETHYAGEAGQKLLADVIAGHMRFTDALQAAGVDWSGSELAPTGSASTLTQDGVVHDGPFAETHEQLGGFYLVDVADHAAAVEWARKIPLSPGGKIEIRPTGDNCG